MILRLPAEHEYGEISLQMVLSSNRHSRASAIGLRTDQPKADAGIQVCFGELAWIPAFAGMTEPRRPFVFIPAEVFSKEVTTSTREWRF